MLGTVPAVEGGQVTGVAAALRERSLMGALTRIETQLGRAEAAGTQGSSKHGAAGEHCGQKVCGTDGNTNCRDTLPEVRGKGHVDRRCWTVNCHASRPPFTPSLIAHLPEHCCVRGSREG